MDPSRSVATTTQVIFSESEPPPGGPTLSTQQDILQITLSGPSLLVTILTIVVSIHLLQPSLTCMLLVLAPIPFIIHNDYINFINLGPGGTPSTFVGYLRITCLRLFALSDTYSPIKYDDLSHKIYPAVGYFQGSSFKLLKRDGPRPRVVGIAPHRQLDQPGCPVMNKMLRAALKNIALKTPDLFQIGISCFEKKGLALFARHPINITCKGEICHVHSSDFSMHMNMHPDDARIVLGNSWGERHPLARGGWMKRFVPREFMLIYAPRNLTELRVVCSIIEAAAFWVSGERLEMKFEESTAGKE